MHAGRNVRGTVVFDPPTRTPAVSAADEMFATSR